MILIVDDNKEDWKLFEKIIIQLYPDKNIKIHYAESASEARKLLLINEYKVIFLDVYLRSEDGIVLLSEIKNSPIIKSNTIVVMSSVIREIDKVTCDELNALYIEKQMTFDANKAQLKHLLDPVFA